MAVESDAGLESPEVDAPAILGVHVRIYCFRRDLARPSRRLLPPCRRRRRASAATSVSSAAAGDAQRTDARRASEVAGGARSRVHDGRSRAGPVRIPIARAMDIVAARAIQGLRSARCVLKSRERRAMRAFLAALALLLMFFVASPVAAALTEAELSDVALRPVGGAAAPPDIAFTDDDGRAVALGDVTARPRHAADPRRLQLPYDLRSDTRRSPRAAIRDFGLVAGRDFNLVVVGIDPRATRADAARMKAEQFGDDPALAPRAFSLWRRARDRKTFRGDRLPRAL